MAIAGTEPLADASSGLLAPAGAQQPPAPASAPSRMHEPYAQVLEMSVDDYAEHGSAENLAAEFSALTKRWEQDSRIRIKESMADSLEMLDDVESRRRVYAAIRSKDDTSDLSPDEGAAYARVMATADSLQEPVAFSPLVPWQPGGERSDVRGGMRLSRHNGRFGVFAMLDKEGLDEGGAVGLEQHYFEIEEPDRKTRLAKIGSIVESYDAFREQYRKDNQTALRRLRPATDFSGEKSIEERQRESEEMAFRRAFRSETGHDIRSLREEGEEIAGMNDFQYAAKQTQKELFNRFGDRLPDSVLSEAGRSLASTHYQTLAGGSKVVADAFGAVGLKGGEKAFRWYQNRSAEQAEAIETLVSGNVWRREGTKVGELNSIVLALQQEMGDTALDVLFAATGAGVSRTVLRRAAKKGGRRVLLSRSLKIGGGAIGGARGGMEAAWAQYDQGLSEIKARVANGELSEDQASDLRRGASSAFYASFASTTISESIPFGRLQGIFTQLPGDVRKTIMQRAMSVFKQAAIEGTTEGIQSVMDTGWANKLYRENKPFFDKAFEGAGEEAIVGMIMGGGAAAVAETFGGALNKEMGSRVQPTEKTGRDRAAIALGGPDQSEQPQEAPEPQPDNPTPNIPPRPTGEQGGDLLTQRLEMQEQLAVLDGVVADDGAPKGERAEAARKRAKVRVEIESVNEQIAAQEAAPADTPERTFEQNEAEMAEIDGKLKVADDGKPMSRSEHVSLLRRRQKLKDENKDTRLLQELEAEARRRDAEEARAEAAAAAATHAETELDPTAGEDEKVAALEASAAAAEEAARRTAATPPVEPESTQETGEGEETDATPATQGTPLVGQPAPTDETGQPKPKLAKETPAPAPEAEQEADAGSQGSGAVVGPVAEDRPKTGRELAIDALGNEWHAAERLGQLDRIAKGHLSVKKKYRAAAQTVKEALASQAAAAASATAPTAKPEADGEREGANVRNGTIDGESVSPWPWTREVDYTASYPDAEEPVIRKERREPIAAELEKYRLERDEKNAPTREETISRLLRDGGEVKRVQSGSRRKPVSQGGALVPTYEHRIVLPDGGYLPLTKKEAKDLSEKQSPGSQVGRRPTATRPRAGSTPARASAPQRYGKISKPAEPYASERVAGSKLTRQRIAKKHGGTAEDYVAVEDGDGKWWVERKEQGSALKFSLAPEPQAQSTAPKWPADFSKIRPMTSGAALKRDPDYKVAKAGDREAATNLVLRRIKIDRVRELAAQHPGAIVVPVHAEETSGRNALPEAFAETFAEIGGLDVDRGIVQSSHAGRTGSGAAHRLAHRPIFDGPVEAGRDYIIVDDMATQGGTLSELRAHIEREGGRVVAASSMAAAHGSTTLAVQSETLLALQDKHGHSALSDFLQRHNLYGGNPAALTQSEARWLLRAASLDAAGDRIAAARSEGGGRGNTGASPQAQGRGASGAPLKSLSPPADKKGNPPGAAKVRRLQKRADRLARNLPVKVRVATLAEVGDAIGDKASRARGYYGNGEVVIVADNIGSDAELSEVIAHEVLGHHGLAGILKNNPAARKELLDLARSLMANPSGRAALTAVADSYGYDIKTTEGLLNTIEEALSQDQEALGLTDKNARSMWQRIAKWLREFFDKTFGKPWQPKNTYKDFMARHGGEAMGTLRKRYGGENAIAVADMLQRMRDAGGRPTRKPAPSITPDGLALSLAEDAELVRDADGKVSGLTPAAQKAIDDEVAAVLDAAGDTLTDPSGKPSQLYRKLRKDADMSDADARRTWALTRTRRFKEWFGDWEAVQLQQRFDALVDEAMASKGQRGKRMQLRRLTEEEAAHIKEIVGFDVSDLHHEITPQYLWHAIKGHGDAAVEAADGQVAITADDLKRIPEILDSWDWIEEGTTKQGRKSVRFIKKVNGSLYYVERAFPPTRRKDGRMDGTTMWKERRAASRSAARRSVRRRYARSAGEAQGKLPFANGRVNPDSVSKVVDDNGEPLVVWHGTPNGEFDAFDPDMAGENSGDLGKYGRGFYLSASRAYATEYEDIHGDGKSPDATTMPTFVSIVNPFAVETNIAVGQRIPSLQKIAAKHAEELDAYLSDELEYAEDERRAFFHRLEHDATSVSDTLEDFAGRIGADGVLQEDAAEIVAFTPSQIKGIANAGSFSPATGQFKFSLTPPAEVGPKESGQFARRFYKRLLSVPDHPDAIPAARAEQFANRFASRVSVNAMLARGAAAIERMGGWTDAREAVKSLESGMTSVERIGATITALRMLRDIADQLRAAAKGKPADVAANYRQQAETLESERVEWHDNFLLASTDMARGLMMHAELGPIGVLKSVKKRVDAERETEKAADKERHVPTAVRAVKTAIAQSARKAAAAALKALRGRSQSDANAAAPSEDAMVGIAEEHYRGGINANRSALADKIRSKTGVSAAESRRLAKVMDGAFAGSMESEKKKALGRMKRSPKLRSRRKGILEKFYEAAWAGAFDPKNTDAALDDYYTKLGIPKSSDLTKEQLREIERLAEKGWNAPDGRPKQLAALELLDYAANLNKNLRPSTLMSRWFANTLSSPRTHVNILVDNATQMLELLTTAVGDLSQGKIEVAAAGLIGAKVGMKKSLHASLASLRGAPRTLSGDRFGMGANATLGKGRELKLALMRYADALKTETRKGKRGMLRAKQGTTIAQDFVFRIIGALDGALSVMFEEQQAARMAAIDEVAVHGRLAKGNLSRALKAMRQDAESAAELYEQAKDEMSDLPETTAKERMIKKNEIAMRALDLAQIERPEHIRESSESAGQRAGVTGDDLKLIAALTELADQKAAEGFEKAINAQRLDARVVGTSVAGVLRISTVFMGVAGRLSDQMLEATPGLGLARMYGVNKKGEWQRVSPENYARIIGKQVTGSALALGAYALASAFKDWDEEKDGPVPFRIYGPISSEWSDLRLREESQIKPWSISIYGKNFQFAEFRLLAGPLSLAAYLSDREDQGLGRPGVIEAAGDTLVNFWKVNIERDILGTARTLTYQPTRVLADAGKSVVEGAVPLSAMQRDMERLMRGGTRRVSTGEAPVPFAEMVEAFGMRLPYLRGTLGKPALNRFGLPISTDRINLIRQTTLVPSKKEPDEKRAWKIINDNMLSLPEMRLRPARSDITEALLKEYRKKYSTPTSANEVFARLETETLTKGEKYRLLEIQGPLLMAEVLDKGPDIERKLKSKDMSREEANSALSDMNKDAMKAARLQLLQELTGGVKKP